MHLPRSQSMSNVVRFSDGSHDKDGFWSPHTSTIDWCEPNYAHSHYVAEFFNCFSSLWITFGGLLTAYWSYKCGHNPRLTVFGLLTAIVGVGSALFHGSLHFSTQLLDELPMIYTIAQSWYIWMTALHRIRTTLDPSLSQHSDWLATVPTLAFLAPVARAMSAVGLGFLTRSRARALVAYVAFWTFIHAGVGFTTVFQVHFMYMTVMGVVLSFEFRRHFLHLPPAASALKGWMVFHVGITLCAGASWLTDNFMCQRLLSLPVYPPLHAVWHILCGGGTYSALIVAALAESLARDAELLPLPGTVAAVHHKGGKATADDDDDGESTDSDLFGPSSDVITGLDTDDAAAVTAAKTDASGAARVAGALSAASAAATTAPLKLGHSASGGATPTAGPGSYNTPAVLEAGTRGVGTHGGTRDKVAAQGTELRLQQVRDAQVPTQMPVIAPLPIGCASLTMPFPYRYVLGPNRQSLD